METLAPLFAATDSHIWRKNELWCEANDLTLKHQYKTIQRLYEKYSGRFALPGAAKFVSPLEFAQMVEDSNVISDYFTFKEVYPIWNLSMMTQRDEIGNDKHLNMNFTEFIEAICRVANKISIPNRMREDFEPEDWVNPSLMKEWERRSLSQKIESYLLQLSKACLGARYYDEGVVIME